MWDVWFNIHTQTNENGMREKSYTIISIDTEKAFDKIQHLFMIKTLIKLGIEGMYPNIIKAVCYKPTAIFMIIFNGERLKALTRRSGAR